MSTFTLIKFRNIIVISSYKCIMVKYILGCSCPPSCFNTRMYCYAKKKSSNKFASLYVMRLCCWSNDHDYIGFFLSTEDTQQKLTLMQWWLQELCWSLLQGVWRSSETLDHIQRAVFLLPIGLCIRRVCTRPMFILGAGKLQCWGFRHRTIHRVPSSTTGSWRNR